MNNTLDNEFSLRDLLRTFDRRRNILLGTATLVLIVAVLSCIFMTRRYEAKGIFELQKSSSDALDLEGLMTGGGAGGAADSLSVNIDMQTQVDILKSDNLALKVIQELNLEQNEDFKPRFSLIGHVMGLISPAGPKDPVGASLENSPQRRSNVLRVFAKNLTVKAIAGTRLIEVDYSNPDPKVAAVVTNHLIQALIDYTFQTKFIATTQISGWLENQLGDLRKQSEDLQSKVVALQQGSGIFGVGGTDLQGKPVVYSPVLDRLQQSSALLTQTEMSRVIKESVYRVAQSGNAELISQLSGTGIANESSPGLSGSLTLIQSLRTQEATLKAQIGQDASQFGPNYPKLVEERASLESVENSLRAEVNRVAGRAKNDYDIAVETEKGARKAFESDRQAAEKLNDKTIEYTILSRESEESQMLYQDLLKRLKEAGILEGLRSSNLTIVDTAGPPSRPSRPNVPLYLALGLFFGLFLGGATALTAEAIDNKIQGADEIEAMHFPLLGILPQVKPSEIGMRPTLMEKNSSQFNEGIRALRSAILIARGGAPPKIIIVTSGSAQEGKSTVSINLAAALSQYDKQVLLVEADMRRPVLGKRLQIKSASGLSNLLSNTGDVSAEPEVLPDFPNLHVLLAGTVPPYPSELLGSASMQAIVNEWRQTYDFVVIDSPPVLPVTDVQILMPFADSTILIARNQKTTRVGLQRAFKMIARHAADPAHPAVGVLLNGISRSSSAYYGYYGSYASHDYYSGEGTQNEKS